MEFDTTINSVLVREHRIKYIRKPLWRCMEKPNKPTTHVKLRGNRKIMQIISTFQTNLVCRPKFFVSIIGMSNYIITISKQSNFTLFSYFIYNQIRITAFCNIIPKTNNSRDSSRSNIV